jgi:hypothetical protein
MRYAVVMCFRHIRMPNIAAASITENWVAAGMHANGKKIFLVGVAAALLMALVIAGHATADREMRGCFVARFERFEFRDAADGATYFVVAADDGVTQQIKDMIGESTFVVVPASMTGRTSTVASGVGPNARYRAMIKAKSVSILADQRLCVVPD